MFPAPENVKAPGLSCPTEKLGETARHLIQKLQDGKECEDEVMGYLVSGGQPDGRLLLASLGNRYAGKKGCPKSLTVLIAMGADAKVEHPQLGSAIHVASRNGDVEIAQRLIDADADLTVLDADGNPPLCVACLSGAAGVAMALIRGGADVQWQRHDGATILHVLVSWLCDPDAAGMMRRLKPVGNEPAKLVDMFIHHGLDPTIKQRWEGKGLSAFDTWRARKEESPWMEDETCWQDFPKAAQSIHKSLTAAFEAMEQKAKGNRYFTDKKYDEACKAWQRGREYLSSASIDGHHMAVLWANEANALLKKGDKEGCRAACEEGLTFFCNEKIKEKLRFRLAECTKEEVVSDCKEETRPTAEAKPKPKAKRSAMKKGFFDEATDDLYGPDGSKNGQMPLSYRQPINGGEAWIDVPINQKNCSKMQILPMPDMNKDDSDDEN